MVTVSVKLSELYSAELKLHNITVDEYKALGIEKLIVDIEKNAVCCSRTSMEPVAYELLEGCHRSKALLELGYSGEVTLQYTGPDDTDTAPILLKDVPIVEDAEYEEYRIEYDLL
ncbi:MAG: hypothetical protein IH934_05630 [Nanoarchaeota archaeon]|nr:hypothetical protein [Nanoarchaeota archaeon]